MRRSEYFDVLKGIGILCVFYGHTAEWASLPSRLIFNFHMPLFFMISGVFFDPCKSPDFKSLLARLWKGLLLPYCLFVLVGYAVHFNTAMTRWTSSPGLECLRILHGDAAPSVWFLVCLAMVQAIAWLMRQPTGKMAYMVMIVSGVMAHLIYHYVPRSVISSMPFMLASVPAAMMFFVFGGCIRNALFRLERASMKSSVVLPMLSVMAVLLVAACLVSDDRISIITATFDLRLLPACALGLGTSALLAKFLASFRLPRLVLSCIGRRSLCLFALEAPVAYVLYKMGIVSHENMMVNEHSCMSGFLRMAFVLAFAYAASYPTLWVLGKLQTGRVAR